jgi:hypothetical protein
MDSFGSGRRPQVATRSKAAVQSKRTGCIARAACAPAQWPAGNGRATATKSARRICAPSMIVCISLIGCNRRRVGGRQRDRPHRPHALPLRRSSALFRLPRRGERDRLRPARRQAVRAGALFPVPALLSARVCRPERGRAEALDAAREQDRATPRRQCRNSLAVSAEAEGDAAANL